MASGRGWNIVGTWGDGTGSASLPPCRGGGVVTRYLLGPRSRKHLRAGGREEMLRRSPFHSAAVHEVMYEMMTSSHVLPLENGRRNGEAPDAPFCGYRGRGDEAASGKGKKAEDDVDHGARNSCYVLPDCTRVDLAGSRAGRNLRRLPVSIGTPSRSSFPFSIWSRSPRI